MSRFAMGLTLGLVGVIAVHWYDMSAPTYNRDFQIRADACDKLASSVTTGDWTRMHTELCEDDHEVRAAVQCAYWASNQEGWRAAIDQCPGGPVAHRAALFMIARASAPYDPEANKILETEFTR